MLALTPAAVQVVKTLADAYNMPDNAGLRIASSVDSAQQEGLEVEFVPEPAERDEVISSDGARVFLESKAAQYLTDKVLDGEVDEQGHVRFELGSQD